MEIEGGQRLLKFHDSIYRLQLSSLVISMFIKGLDFNWSLPLPNDVFTRGKVRKPSTIYNLTDFFLLMHLCYFLMPS